MGAAWVWVILNCGCVVFLLPMMHLRLLPGHLHQWFMMDVGAPLAAALSVAGLWSQMVGPADSYGWMLFNLAMVSFLTPLAAAFATPQIRGLVVHYLAKGAGRIKSQF